MMSVHKELAAVAAEVEAVNKAMMEAAKTPSGKGLNTTFLKDYAAKVKEVEGAFRSAVTAQGDFGVQSMKVASQADRLTEMIQRQKFGLRDLISEHKNLGEVYKQQRALQKSMVMQWGKDASGAIRADLMTPRALEDAGRGWKEMSRQAGFYNQVLSSVSDQTVKWGKNTQWAGRQLMAGISMPIAAAAAGTGALAYQLDKGLTQVVKVYGDAATAATTTDAEIKAATMNTAKNLAAAYGQSAKDSIEITSQLAAAGKTGMELQDATSQVTRARTLGELNLQDAMKATITLQSTYQMNSQKLGETFDFMNSMENQTNLTMQDFVVGIPKTVGVLKEFGGTVQDAGILLAGMKAAGIDAAEGANAIKSISFKVIAPNQGSKDMFEELTGKSFEDTMKGADGVVERLIALSNAVKGLDEEDRVGLIQKMFGLYQGSKTLSLLDQLTSGSEQMTRAFEVANGGAAQWADTANRELNKLQTSGWNKIKQQWETLKIELAEVGQTFLEMGAPILKAVSDIITRFNNLGDGTKKFVLFGAVAAAALGPIIMLAGLFGNLIGNVGKLTTFLVGLGLKFKVLNAEEVIASRLANSLTNDKFKEAEAFSTLAAQMSAATGALHRYNMEQVLANRGLAGAMPHPRTGSLMIPTAAGGYRPMNKRQQGIYNQTMQEFDPKAGPASGIIASNAEKTRKSWSEISGSTKSYAVAGVAGTVGMIAPSNQLLNNITNAVLIGATIGPMLSKIGFISKAVQTVGLNTKVAASLMGKSLGGVGTKMTGIGRAALGIIPALGPVGIGIAALGVAAGAAFYVMHKNIEKTKQESRDFANSAKTYADIVGYKYTEAGERTDEAGKKILSLNDKVKAFTDANQGAAKAFSEMAGSASSEQEKMNAAVSEGIKAMNHGANAQQAIETTKIALRAMKSTLRDADMEAKIRVAFNFEDPDKVAERRMDDLQRAMQKASRNQFSQGKSESFARWFSGNDEINGNAAEQLKGQAREMWTVFNKADEAEQSKVFEQIRTRIMQNQNDTFKVLQQSHGEQFAKAGIKNANDLARWLQPGGGIETNSLGLNINEINNYRREMGSVNEIIREFGKQAGVSDDKVKKMLDFSQLRAEMPWLVDTQKNLQSVAKSQAEWDAFVKESKNGLVNWSQAEMLARLNLYRRRAGLEDATSVEQGFGDAVQNTTEKLFNNAEAHKAVADAIARQPSGFGDAGVTLDMDNPENVQSMVNAYKEAFSGAMDSVYSDASRIMDEQNQAVMDGIERRGDAAKDALDKQQDKMEAKFDRQNEAFEERWDKRKKAISNAYDAQIAKVQAAIDAEQKAEEIRQKLYEAEKTRIQRLADLYNRSIDINMAITSGKLDDAAKMQNDVDSQQQQWNLDDAAANSGDASSQTVEALNKRKDAIDKAKDKALELADAQEKAEQKALKATQDAEKKKLDARKKALDQSIRAEQDAARRKQEANKRALDAELAALRAFVPQNEAQLSAHIGRVEAAYGKYGVRLTQKGNGWGTTVANALSNATHNATIKMSNDSAWAAMGKVAADKMAGGAFNMSLADFMKWIMTGALPKNYQAPKGFSKSEIAKYNAMGIRVAGANSQGGLTRHKGGYIGDSSGGSRAGYSGKNLSQSEVNVTALKGESILNRGATRNLGMDFVDMANRGMLPKNIGGPDLATGFGGMMSAVAGGLMRKAMYSAIMGAGLGQQLIESGAAGMAYDSVGKAGKYGDWSFDASQIRNAGIIASTGKSLGASNRDIIIALMTALQESTLRNLNYGDRDSLGLFQQRAAWGSAKARTTPAEAAKMFFLGGAQGQRGLFDFPNRGKMSLGQAAQAVQVSAFPSAYDKWANEASEILSGLQFTAAGVPMTMGAGGWVRPASGPVSSHFGMRKNPVTGVYKLHAGADIAAGMGAQIRAAKGGTVVATQGVGQSGGYGNYTIIDHGGGIRTAYAHQSRFGVRAGQTVQAGQVIGYVGSTGNSTGPHLHFEYMKNGQRVNPNAIIPGLRTGGFTMSDGLAQLHKGETVLTAPLSETLKQGINNMDKSQHFGYNVNMNFDGATFNSDIDLQKTVEDALLNVQNRVGPVRRVGSR